MEAFLLFRLFRGTTALGVAVKVARENIKDSGLDNVSCDVSDLLRQVDRDSAPYDVICANIVADIIQRRGKTNSFLVCDDNAWQG